MKQKIFLGKPRMLSGFGAILGMGLLVIIFVVPSALFAGPGSSAVDGTPLGANPRQELNDDEPSNTDKRWAIDMVAPTSSGTRRTQWMVRHGDNVFGPNVYLVLSPAEVTDVNVSQPLRVVEPLTITPTNPIVGQTVTAQLTVKNVGEQAIGLRYLTVSARGPDSPDCTDWDCPWADFSPVENLTLQPNQEYTYHSQRSFDGVGDYFAQANYQDQQDTGDAWHPFGNQVEFSVSPGLTVVEPLALTPADPVAGQTVTAQFTAKNVGDQPITLPLLTVPARGPAGPDCTDWDCPWADFQAVEDVTLQPDDEYEYSAQRSFDEAGDYFAQPDYQDAGDHWHPFGNRVDFSVSPGLEVVEDLSLSPADPVVGQTITARFKVRNASGQVITLRRLVVGAKGPNCTDWECPNWGDFPAYEHLTLQPDEEFIYERQRLYTQAGDGYFAQVVYMYGENDWHHVGTKIDFSVSPGLQVVEDLTLSPADPLEEQPVTARYTVKNVGEQAITLRWLGVVARGPDCTDWDCDNGGDFPRVENVALQPNGEYTYAGQRGFSSAGSGYFAEPALADPNGWWFPVPGSRRVEFSVSSTSQPEVILSPGWNHIALPLSPTVSYTAQTLIDEINRLGGSVEEVCRWQAGGWECHIDGRPFNNFAIELYKDYFLKSGQKSTWTVHGETMSSTQLELQAGWNSIGVPHSDEYTAERLCQAIARQCGDNNLVIEIDHWHVGGWEGHICGLPFNNFGIERGQGYFIKVTRACSVELAGESAANFEH